MASDNNTTTPTNVDDTIPEIRGIDEFRKIISDMSPAEIEMINPEKIPENIPPKFINKLPAETRKSVEDLIFSRNMRMIKLRQKIKKELGKETITALDISRQVSINGSINQIKNKLLDLKKIKQSAYQNLSNMIIAQKQIEFTLMNEKLIAEVRQEHAQASVALHTLKSRAIQHPEYRKLILPAHEKLRQHVSISYQLISVFYLERLLACHYLMAKSLAAISKQDNEDREDSEKIKHLNKTLLASQSRVKRTFMRSKAQKNREAMQKEITVLSSKIKTNEVPISDADLTLWLDAVVDYSLYKNRKLRGHMILNKARNNLLQLLLRYCQNQETSALHIAKNPFLRANPEKVIQFTLKSEQFVLDYFNTKRIEVTTLLSLTAKEKSNDLAEIEGHILQHLKRNKHLR